MVASGSVVYYNVIVKTTPPWGPTPTPGPPKQQGASLDPSRARVLRLVADHPAPAGTTVKDLGAALGGHPNTARHHLRALVATGLVEERRTPPDGGRGRPAARYVLTAAGRDAAAPDRRGAAADEYVALAGAFAERLAARGGDPGDDARAIGRAWGASLTDRPDPPVGDGVEEETSSTGRVVGLLDRLGFSPRTDPGSDTTVSLRTCPLLDAARRHPDVVCEVHLGLVAGALEARGEPSDGLRLAPFARPGACVLTLPATLGR
jgi:predicted ArsR family transcriptional regulator